MKKQKYSLLKVLMILMLLFFYLPIGFMIVFSFNSSKSLTHFTGFSMQWYSKMLADSSMMESLYITIIVAIIATVVSTIVGTISAIGLSKSKKVVHDLIMQINDFPLMNPEIVTAIGLMLFFITFNIEKGFATLLIAHIAFCIPYVILSVMPKIRSLDPNLADAAMDLGCTPWMALTKVIVPQIMPGIVSGALIAFTMSFDDFIISYFVTGKGIKNLSMDDRFTIANMAIEAGGKNGIFPVDELTEQYMKEHSKRPYKVYEADEDAVYEQEYTIDLSTLKSTVAFPHLPENTRTIDEITEDVVIDQSVIGSCTNGRIEDLRCAAEILKGRKVKKGVRCIVIPATQQIYLQAMREGLLEIFIEAGPCLGGYMGILAEGERCISTTNRNFVGRMGHVKSEVYLASPAVAAASAVTGKISAPAALGL